MPEDKLLEELVETLTDARHKKYVIAYIRSKVNGLSTQFDEFVETDVHET
jgi:hypothetical protein